MAVARFQSSHTLFRGDYDEKIDLKRSCSIPAPSSSGNPPLAHHSASRCEDVDAVVEQARIVLGTKGPFLLEAMLPPAIREIDLVDRHGGDHGPRLVAVPPGIVETAAFAPAP